MTLLDERAAAFAGEHGSFSLHFDAGQDYRCPGDCPWTLLRDSGETSGWGGFTAVDALDLAAAELAPQD